MDKLQAAVSLSLRDTEICTAAADVLDITATLSTKQIHRVLAVVTHKYPIAEETQDAIPEEKEEGCLFVMKYDTTSPTELYPYLLFPINSELKVSLKQHASGDSSGGFELTLKAPRGRIVLSSRDMHSLSSVLEESRRLKSLDDPTSNLVSPISLSSPILHSRQDSKDDWMEDDFEIHWKWLHFYISRRFSRILSFKPPKPLDIRFISTGFELSQSSAGMPVDEERDAMLIRDEWVRHKLTSRKEEYSEERQLKLRIGTFNVNGKLPSQSLSSWLWGNSGEQTAQTIIANHSATNEIVSSDTTQNQAFRDAISLSKKSFLMPPSSNPPSIVSTPASEKLPVEHEPHPISDSSSIAASTTPSSLTPYALDNETLGPSSPPTSISTLPEEYSDLPDLFILGFQEVDISTESLIYRTSPAKEEAWSAAIFEALGKVANQYIKLISKQLVGVLIIAVIRKDLQSIVKEMSTSTGAVGLLGFIANKGATALRLSLNSTVVTFVCSHLAAFDDYVEKRNSDFGELAKKLDFPITSQGTRSMRALSANIWETDMLFWLGDLNYRIDLPDDEIRSFLSKEKRELDTLTRFDQLKTAALHKRAFIGFEEENIDFLPTYRYGELPRDELGYDLKRKPAWTDRILYISPDQRSLVQKSYRSHPLIVMSDHRPVSADFEIIINEKEERKYFQTLKSVFRTLGNFEDAEEPPSVKIVDGLEIYLGDIEYLRPLTRTVRIQNTGKNACAFRFVPLEVGGPICREWMEVKPLSGLLLPDEELAVEITVNIDDRTASFLNQGDTKLSESLVLHLINGTDHIIFVSGDFKKTCFANSLAWLVRSPGPIRTKGMEPLIPEEKSLNAPRELMFLVEWLMTNGLNIPDLFLLPGKDDLIYTIRKHLDTEPLDSASVIKFPEEIAERDIALAFGSALIQFLASLSEPVIPWVLHPRCAMAQERDDVFEILDEIPGFARNVFVTVTAFLHFIAHSGGEDRSEKLARIFADVLLRDNPRAPPGVPVLTPLRKRRFILLTIS